MSRCPRSRFWAAVAVCLTPPGSMGVIRSATASEPTGYGESESIFTRHVATMLREKCFGCHGNDPDDIAGELDLRTAAATLAGGESGEPSLVPGDPDRSPIYLAATRDHDDWSAMPPKDAEAFDDRQLATLRRWIETGGEWPDEDRRREIAAAYEATWSVEDGVVMPTTGALSEAWANRRYDPDAMWAYRPLPTAESIQGDAPEAATIDSLITEAMPAGLSPAPRADRRTLIRRVTFDLTGLPPTPREVDAFLMDDRDDAAALASVVERLLASSHHGERMAQHWLDVTRYADSSGFANDYERGNAWRYRDYVVRAFNDDKPFDNFIREQIAGDEIDPDDPESIVATGFLRMGPWELTAMEVPRVARQRFLDDVTNAVGETFLGHSLQCARCHDHKFDPVPTHDYYAIQSVFATTQLAERAAAFTDDENTNGFEGRRYLERARGRLNDTMAELDAVKLSNAEDWFAERGKPIDDWNAAVAEVSGNTPPGHRFNAARKRMRTSGVDETDYPPKDVGYTPRQFGLSRVAFKGLYRIGWEMDRYEPFALSVYNGPTPRRTAVDKPTRMPTPPAGGWPADDGDHGDWEHSAILTGGDPFSPSTPVRPGVLSVLADQWPAELPDTVDGRRTALADWIADPRNPLTPRVIANRVWQWHFGTPLAANPNNVGSTGGRPTHPRLLDHLARRLIDSGWSIKALHREILASDAYARSSTHPDRDAVDAADPAGTSYAVFHPRRLTAEEMRDASLAVTGELNRTVGGVPAQPRINDEVAFQPRMVMGTFAAAWVPDPTPPQRNRRSLYIRRLRGMAVPMLEVFNAPPMDFHAESRTASTVTPQVFQWFNGVATHDRALALAVDVTSKTATLRDAIALAVRRCYAREATEAELTRYAAHVAAIEATLPDVPEDRDELPTTVTRHAVEENTGEKFMFDEVLDAAADHVPDLAPADVDRPTRALADLCLVLLNANEFVYID